MQMHYKWRHGPGSLTLFRTEKVKMQHGGDAESDKFALARGQVPAE